MKQRLNANWFHLCQWKDPESRTGSVSQHTWNTLKFSGLHGRSNVIRTWTRTFRLCSRWTLEPLAPLKNRLSCTCTAFRQLPPETCVTNWSEISYEVWEQLMLAFSWHAHGSKCRRSCLQFLKWRVGVDTCYLCRYLHPPNIQWHLLSHRINNEFTFRPPHMLWVRLL